MEYDIVSNIITTSVVKAKPITLEAENSPANTKLVSMVSLNNFIIDTP